MYIPEDLHKLLFGQLVCVPDDPLVKETLFSGELEETHETR